jgi:hypothetical protein
MYIVSPVAPRRRPVTVLSKNVSHRGRPSMLMRHLSYFVTLTRKRHFARAAELCNIT